MMLDVFAAITTNFNPVNDTIMLIVIVGGALVYAKTHIPQQTIKNLQDLCDSQTKSINNLNQTVIELKDGRVEDAKSIARLEGQLALFKELPLRDLADGIKRVGESNQHILETLQLTAKINAEDRDVLTKNK